MKQPPHPRARAPASRSRNRRIAALLHGDAGAGLLLIAVAAVALGMANSPWAAPWHALFDTPLPWVPARPLATVHGWIDAGLMSVFFFAVGLEIKREVLIGDLARGRRRRLPVVAAAAGMAVPALVYATVAAGSGAPALLRGWAIPAATDIAFAVGVLGLAGRGLPPSLRLFLLSVAVVDDLGAVAIIALFYSGAIALGWLAAAAAGLAAMVACNRAGIRRGAVFAALAVVVWACVLRSGVQPSIAGVATALTIPLESRIGHRRGDRLLLRMERALAPWSAYAIVPLYALANAGVALSGGAGSGAGHVVALAVMAGLVPGKAVGLAGSVWVADRTGFAARPAGASWRQIIGVCLLGGIGFTMSLFIAALAFPGASGLADAARLGILAGSGMSAVLGFALLRRG